MLTNSMSRKWLPAGLDVRFGRAPTTGGMFIAAPLWPWPVELQLPVISRRQASREPSRTSTGQTMASCAVSASYFGECRAQLASVPMSVPCIDNRCASRVSPEDSACVACAPCRSCEGSTLQLVERSMHGDLVGGAVRVHLPAQCLPGVQVHELGEHTVLVACASAESVHCFHLPHPVFLWQRKVGTPFPPGGGAV